MSDCPPHKGSVQITSVVDGTEIESEAFCPGCTRTYKEIMGLQLPVPTPTDIIRSWRSGKGEM